MAYFFGKGDIAPAEKTQVFGDRVKRGEGAEAVVQPEAGTATSRAACRDELTNCLARAGSTQERADCRRRHTECLNRVGGREQPVGQGPCEGDGYKPPTARGVQISPCRAGYRPVTDEDGQKWCCKEAEEAPGEEPEEEPGADTACAGGYRLADNPIAAGGGSIWSDEVITPEMGFYRNPQAAGHWLHKAGKWYFRKDIVEAINAGTLGSLAGQEGGMCSKGTLLKTINGEAWCCPAEGAGGGGAGGGEWGWSPELEEWYNQILQLGQEYTGGGFEYGDDILALMASLGGRGQEFMNMPFGFSEAEKTARFGRDYDILRQGGRARGDEILNFLSSEGLRGTGAAQDVMTEQAWQTEGTISDLMRDLFLADESQKRQDMYGYTQATQNIMRDLAGLETGREGINLDRQRLGSQLFGQGMSYEAIIEEMNRARRGEQSGAMAMFMQWMMSLLGAWGG